MTTPAALPFVALFDLEIAAMGAARYDRQSPMPRFSVCGTPVNVFAYAYSHDGRQTGVSMAHYHGPTYDHCRIGKSA